MDVDGIVKDVLSKATADGALSGGYSSSYEVFMGFMHAVAWKEEKWLQAVLAGHVLLWVAVIASRKNSTMQGFLGFLAGGLVFMSERINSWCAAHWKEFSTQNYFDKRGVFAGAVFAGPLILVLLFQLFNALYHMSQLLIVTKRAELKEKLRNKKKD